MKYANNPLASRKPNGAPSCGIIAYQPRRLRGALSDSREAKPSQAPPSANPWLTRQTPRRKMLAAPIVAYPGRKLITAVEKPSSSRAEVSLTPRPYSRSTVMKIIDPIGRAIYASEKTMKE